MVVLISQLWNKAEDLEIADKATVSTGRTTTCLIIESIEEVLFCF